MNYFKFVLLFSLNICNTKIIICLTIEPNTNKERHNCEGNTNFRKLHSFCWHIPKDYDKQMEPWTYHDNVDRVLPYFYNFEFVVKGVQEVNDFERTIKLNMYFIVKWWEPRIVINHTTTILQTDRSAQGVFVPIPMANLDILWTPDIEVYEMNSFDSAKVFKEPMASLKINQSGIMRYSSVAKLTMSCGMDFEKYPFDSHYCIFRAGSYAHHDEIVNCTAKLVKYEVYEQQTLQYMVRLENLPSKYHTWHTPEHGWATCGFGIELKRTKTQMIIQVYLTSISLVLVTWFSFTIDPTVIPGRMGMLITIFLVLINIFVGVKNSSPTSNGLNAVDVFLVVCIGQVFAALCEYTLVLQKYGQPKNESTSQKPSLNSKWNPIDKVAIYAFPLVFTTFLFIYFVIYMN